MSQVMEHVHQLAEVIGPRPATTDAEASAADYIEDVFRAHGLETERQEFDCPRTASWAAVIYHTLTIGAAVLSLWWGWPALVLAVLAFVGLRLELAGRPGVSSLLPKGPSQNIIARHVPHARRGERLKRVIIVAHYDSAKSSLDYGPALTKNRALLGALGRWTTLATPIVILIGLLPFAAEWKPWTGYAAIVAAAYLIVPLAIELHHELLGHVTDGANDNASGVAAMFGIMEATVPAEEGASRTRPIRRTREAALEADVVPDEALLEYRDVTAAPEAAAVTMSFDGLGDVGWETGPMPATGAPAATRTAFGAPDDWAGADAGPLWDERAEDVATPVSRSWIDDEPAEGQGRLELEPEHPDDAPVQAPAGEHGDHRGIRDWLGIGRGFDVRKAGKEIGTWDNIDAEDDDEFGFKAGTAGEDMSDEAARIRRRVTEHVDRALVEKEIWFVATGAKEAGDWGMRALLDAYPDEMRSAYIIVLDSVGAGTLGYITEEGRARPFKSDRRLVSQAKRTARENGIALKGQSQRGFTTDATPALARRVKAMSISAFDINGRVPDRHSVDDVYQNVSPDTVQSAVRFVTALLRDL